MQQTSLVKHRHSCRGCGSKKLICFLDLGQQPLAGAFIQPKNIKTEKKYPLKLYFCPWCKLVQVIDVINPQVLFHQYNYASASIPALSDHFKQYANDLKRTYLKNSGSTLLEFGCNDGILLQHLAANHNTKVYGVDPSRNVTKLGKAKGFIIWCDYFSPTSARQILKKIGPVDVVTGSNVFAHVDNIKDIIDATKIMLKPDGVFIVEVHYLLNLLIDGQYDTFYHEHLSYFSLTSLKRIFQLNGLKIVDVKLLPQVHGGSMRVICTSIQSKITPQPAVAQQLKKESIINQKLLNKFASNVKKHKNKLVKLLNNLKSHQYKLAGYGASGRATILLNYCGIDSKYLDYMVDMSPLRAGKLMPGVHVPIVSPDYARLNPPDYFLVTAWNYWESILQQEQAMIKKGVKFIRPLPKIKII